MKPVTFGDISNCSPSWEVVGGRRRKKSDALIKINKYVSML